MFLPCCAHPENDLRIQQPDPSLLFTPLQRSFMGESRRLDNRRLKRELRLRLRYPTVAEGLVA